MMASTAMSAALGVDSRLMSHSHDVMAVSSDSMHCLTSPPWAGGEAAVSSDPTSGLMVTKLLSRPKTSSSLHRASMQSSQGSARAVQVLGEKLPHPLTQPPPPPPPPERPKTSGMPRARDRGKPPTSSRERSGYVVVPGKELALPICNTRHGRSSGSSDKELLSISTKRTRSAVGARSIAPLSGFSAREKSAALLRELSLSLSLQDGPVSPFKDCLREQWCSTRREDPLLTSSASDVQLSSLTPLHNPDIAEEASSAVPSATDDGSRGGEGRPLDTGRPATERSRTSTRLDISETMVIRAASPTKDSGELTRRSSSPVKDLRSRSLKRASVKRTQSTGNVVTYFGAGSGDGTTVSRKDTAARWEKEAAVSKSPKIITINRLPSPTPVRDSRTKPREKTDSGSKASPKTATPSIAGALHQPNTDNNLPTLPSARSSKDTLVEESPPLLQGEAPSQVTTFDMAIIPLKETLPSPRTRAASYTSDAVSVTDDAVLRTCSLYGQHSTPVAHSEARDGSHPAPVAHSEARDGSHSAPVAHSEARDGSHSAPVAHSEARDGSHPAPVAHSEARDGSHPAPVAHSEARDGSHSTTVGHSEARDGSHPAPVAHSEARDGSHSTTVGHSEARDGSHTTPENPGSARTERKCSQLDSVGLSEASDKERSGVGVKDSRGQRETDVAAAAVPEEGVPVADPILISARSPEETVVDGEAVRVLSQLSSRRTIHLPRRTDSSSSSVSSSSTPTVPLSGSDLLYGGGGGGDGGGSSSSRAHAGGQHGGEEVGEMGAWDPRPASRDKQQRLKELDLHGNKRPPSRNAANNRKGTGFDKVPFDREREELRPLGHPLGPAKQSPLRANGIKNNLLRADQFLPQRSNGREEDLVAMGTIWSPSHLQTRGSGTATTTSSSGKSTSAPTTNSGGSAGGGGSGGTLPGRRPVNLSTSTSTRQLLHHQSGSGMGGASFGGPGGSGMGNCGVRAAKEVEPKYSDPLSGASPTFQQRLMELAALEAETVRWERSKKIKKKPRQDRDS